MDESFLRQVREAELQLALPFLQAHANVLEIGAGSGWQARRLADLGFAVSAVDIQVPDQPCWDVRTYDGRVLPYANGSFDHVFSSNALEHVDDLQQTLAEIRRVLKAGGTSVHIVPSASWRFWTSLTHYPYMARQAARRLFNGRARAARSSGGSLPGAAPQLRKVLVAERHGAHRSMIWELRGFTAHHWKERLSSRGESILRCSASGIYYSGYALLGSALDMRARQRLSRVFGSSCHLVVLGYDVRVSRQH